MKKLLLFLLTIAGSAGASTTMTVPITTYIGSVTRGAVLQVTLQNCINARVVGGAYISNKVQNFDASSGTVTAVLYDNTTQIDCSGAKVSFYSFAIVFQGTTTNIGSFVLVPGTFNLTTLTPCVSGNCVPPISPTGDNTYLRLDGGNSGLLNLLYIDTLKVKVLNKTLYADQYPGNDFGARVNAAFADCGGTAMLPVSSCIVKATPGSAYVVPTTIHIPNTLSHGYVYNPQLQLEGSSISYTGSGDAIAVHGENANAPGSTGIVANGSISAASYATGVNLFHFTSRLGFTLDRLSLSGGATCILLENTNTDGGPGYHEEDTFTNFQTQNCYQHVAGIRTTGGTASFEYNHFDNWHLQMGGENTQDECGICVVASTDWQGLYMVAKVNTSSAVGVRVSVIQADTGGVFRGYLDIHGENTGGAALPFVLYAKNGGNIHMDGSIVVTGFQTGTDGGQFSQAIVNTYGYHAVENPSQFGAPARRCAYLYDAQSPTHNMAQVGAELDCFEQWQRRATSSSDPVVQSPIAGGAPFFNIMFIQNNGHVGIGNGYGTTADGSGVQELPPYFLSVRDSFGISYSGSASASPSVLYAPNLTTGNRVCQQIGQGATTNNSMVACFNYIGAGSTSNSITFFALGNEHPVTISADGTVKAAGLSGSGKALLCLQADGTMYRGTTTTCP